MSNRWLVVIGGVVAILIILGVVVAISTQGKTPVLAEDTSEGTVQRYLMALEKEDYQQAYGYLASSVKGKTSYQEFRRGLAFSQNQQRQIILEKAKVLDGTAEVIVTISEFHPSGPLTFRPSESSFKATFFLQREDSKWYISESTWPFWLWSIKPPRPEPVR